jgi:hypothetical protein
MTLRDYFAGQVVKSSIQLSRDNMNQYQARTHAQWAYMVADCMLDESKRRKDTPMTDTKPDTVDTSAEAVDRVIDWLPSIDNSGRIDPICHRAKYTLHALAAERDTLSSEVTALRKQAAKYTYIGKDGKSVLAKDLEDERDALRLQLAEARNAALVEAIEVAGDWEENRERADDVNGTYVAGKILLDILDLKTKGDTE